VSRARAGVTTVYLGGAWEQDVQSGASTKTRAFITLQGRAIAQRERVVSPVSDTTIYLHGDHLGSVSAATSSTGAILSRQAFTPWGELRAGGGDITQTTRDFTGQRKDGTGLLYYDARYYDPQLGRFLSPDSIVPGNASGKGGKAATLGQDGGAALRPLTVDFHESGFAATLAREDYFTQAKGFWFQLSGQDRRQAKVDTEPSNPQALNRYSYVLNIPLSYTDPTGHNYLAAGKTYLNERSDCQRGYAVPTVRARAARSGSPGSARRASGRGPRTGRETGSRHPDTATSRVAVSGWRRQTRRP